MRWQGCKDEKWACVFGRLSFSGPWRLMASWQGKHYTRIEHTSELGWLYVLFSLLHSPISHFLSTLRTISISDIFDNTRPSIKLGLCLAVQCSAPCLWQKCSTEKSQCEAVEVEDAQFGSSIWKWYYIFSVASCQVLRWQHLASPLHSCL